MQYRRAHIPGGSYFFTVVTAHRRVLFSDEANVNVLREALRKILQKRPFRVDAMVVLPEHLHCIWTLPDGDADYSTRWRLVKTEFTKRCDPGSRDSSTQPGGNGSAGIWQKRYWEHLIRDDTDLRRHIEYIHYNPVKHGLVRRPADWPYSSFHRYVESGVYPLEWGSSEIELPDGVGRE